MSNNHNQNISFKCLGNPQFYDDDSEQNETKTDVDKQKKFYTFNKLPGDVLLIEIINGPMKYEMCIDNSEGHITKNNIQ